LLNLICKHVVKSFVSLLLSILCVITTMSLHRYIHKLLQSLPSSWQGLARNQKWQGTRSQACIWHYTMQLNPLVGKILPTPLSLSLSHTHTHMYTYLSYVVCSPVGQQFGDSRGWSWD
jgi:hypothetical protein